jgi:hypothetical protein
MKPKLLISAYPCFDKEACFAEPFFKIYRSIVDLPFRDKKEGGLSACSAGVFTGPMGTSLRGI